MPYIRHGDKMELDPPIHLLARTLRARPLALAGRLNYAITMLLLSVLPDGYTYDDLSDCVKALEMAKLEFYRRRVAPYENAKAEENGDVYT